MITVSGLEFTYPKADKKVINGLNFEIAKGEIFGFLGPSGAGKTTTQRIIIGLLRGYSGNAAVMGKERSRWGKDFFERIGVAFDFPNLYEKLTPYENLSLLGSYYKNNPANIDELLDKVGLLPDRNKKVESFSKGMKMRLNFIRSIMHDPELLFFDEPTSGLDPVNAKIIRSMIKALKSRGKTVFLTTHNMTEADQLCDRIAFIVEGVIPVIDNPKELKIKHGRKQVAVEYTSHSSGEYIVQQFPLRDIGNNPEFLNILKNHKIQTMHSQEATLEDIFIKLTGRELL